MTTATTSQIASLALLGWTVTRRGNMWIVACDGADGWTATTEAEGCGKALDALHDPTLIRRTVRGVTRLYRGERAAEQLRAESSGADLAR